MTALHHAAAINNPEIIGLLLRYGASKQSIDDREKTPLDHARDLDAKKAIELLSK